MKNLSKIFLPSILIGVFTYSCSPTSTTVGVCGYNFIDMENSSNQPIIEYPVSLGDSVVTQNGITCTETTYEWAPGISDPMLMDPTADCIYPGAIISASSISDGSYALITGERAPLTISWSIANGTASPSVVVNNPTLSNVRAGIQDIVNQDVTGSTMANVSYDSYDVYSTEQLMLKVGGGYKFPKGKVEASFNFNDENIQTRMVVKFQQVYYSVDVDAPQNPEDFWVNCPDPTVFNGYAPVYVSSVKYGRQALFFIESTKSKTEVQAALDATFGNANGSVDVSHQETLNESSIKALIVGGNSDDAVQIVNGFESLKNYITEGGSFSANSQAAPLAYTLRLLDDNSIFKVVMYSKYKVRDCEILPENSVTLLIPEVTQFCPNLTAGGTGLDGSDLVFTAEAKLEISADRKTIVRKLRYYVFDENNGWFGSDSEAEKIQYDVVYTAPIGKTINTISLESDEMEADFSGTDSNGEADNIKTFSVGDNFVKKFRLRGYAPDELDGCGLTNTHMNVEFHPFSITLQ